jgi:hypothetical protein
VEGLCTKMNTSGLTYKFMKKVILRGIKNYMAKLKRSFLKAGEPGYKPLYVGTSWRRNERKKQKLLIQKNWYKEKTSDEVEKDGGIPTKRKDKVKKAGKIEYSTVVFVPKTRGGILVRKLREREAVMKELTGFGIRFQEAGGSQLKNSFSLALGKGEHCGRLCPPCTSNAEKRKKRRKRGWKLSEEKRFPSSRKEKRY